MHAYSTDDSRAAAYGVIATLAVLAAIASNAVAEALNLVPAWLVNAPTVAGSFGLLYELTDRTTWRWRWVRALGIVETPVIEGVYEGHLVSSYEGKIVPIRLRVEQRWTAIVVRMDVLSPATSTSRSIAAALSRDGHRDARLTYTYKNEVRPGVADADMSDHDGTADLVVDEHGAISGRYFNARGRQGTMTLARSCR